MTNQQLIDSAVRMILADIAERRASQKSPEEILQKRLAELVDLVSKDADARAQRKATGVLRTAISDMAQAADQIRDRYNQHVGLDVL